MVTQISSAFAQALDAFNTKQFALAEDILQRTLKAQTQSQKTPLRNLLAMVFVHTQRFAAAEKIWLELLQEHPGHVDFVSNLALALNKTGRNEAALPHLEIATRKNPNHLNLWLNYGLCLDKSGNEETARLAYEHCLRLDPKHVQVLFNIATMIKETGDYEAAWAAYEKVLAIAPNHFDVLATQLFVQHFIPPFSPADYFERACVVGDMLAAKSIPKGELRPAPVSHPPHDPLRVGFISGDLRTHPVGFFLDGMMAHIDSRRMQIYAYHNSGVHDPLSARLQQYCQSWQVIEHWSDTDICARIAADGIDVLIDLAGLTGGHSQTALARKPAPIQMTWLGYFASTGNPHIDFVLADATAVPPHEAKHWRERVLYIPHLRYCFTPPENAPALTRPPCLSSSTFTFACLQQLPKINHEVLAAWKRILEAVPHARLRIQNTQLEKATQRARLEKRLLEAGLDLSRIDICLPQKRADYLASYAGIDCLLDTWPYPGGTTTAEALWMGVPTITLATPGMLGRQGQALLRAAGLSAWIAHDIASYIHLATTWAQPERRARLAQLRAQLREQLLQTPVFNSRAFAQNWMQTIESVVVKKLAKS